MEDAGLSLKDNIAWMKTRAPHRAQRLSVIYDRRGNELASKDWNGWRVGNLQPTFEPIMWFTKPYKIGTTIADNALTHGVGAFNQNAYLRYIEKPENVISAHFEKGETGFHPTQKPIRLMQALIELTTKPNQLVLDPFSGSGSTLVAAKNLNRLYIGIEVNPEYVKITERRLKNDLLSYYTLKT